MRDFLDFSQGEFRFTIAYNLCSLVIKLNLDLQNKLVSDVKESLALQFRGILNSRIIGKRVVRGRKKLLKLSGSRNVREAVVESFGIVPCELGLGYMGIRK